MLSFLSMIFSYFYFLLFARKFCHGKSPFIKYSNTFPMHSISSLRPCSIPKWVFNEAYLAVPVRFLLSLYGICFPSLSIYLLARPKSIKYILYPLESQPITKLSGFTSLWIIPFVWSSWILYNIWIAIIVTVFKSNFLLHMLKSFYNEGPSKSITITLNWSYEVERYTCGMPWSLASSFVNWLIILAS